MKTKTLFFSLASITAYILSCLWTPTVFAQGKIQVGKLSVQPSISYTGAYNDNIFLEHTNEKNDYVSTLSPGIELGYDGTTPDNFFRIGYIADIVMYADYNDNNYTAHNPYVDAGLRFPAGLYLKFNDDYLNTEDPYGSENNYNIGTQTKRWNNSLRLLAGYEFAGRYAVEPFYGHFMERYDKSEDEWQDRTDNIYGLSLLYSLTPKTAVFGQYRKTYAVYDNQDDGIDMVDFGETGAWDSDNSENYDLTDYFLGVRFSTGAKVSGEAKIGWSEKDFENDYDKDGNEYEDDDTWISETLVNYQATQKTRFSLQLERALEGSPDGDASSYISTVVGMGWNQALVNRFFFDLNLAWENDDYQNEFSGRDEKEYDLYTIDSELTYLWKEWLRSSVGYSYKDRFSGNDDYESGEYQNNEVFIKFTATY